MFTSLAAVAALAITPVATTTNVAPPAPPPLTLEQKAGCGIALTLLEEGMVQIPGAMAKVDPDEKALVKMFVRSMGDQGRTLMAEAFAEGANRQMTAMQVYQIGVRDLFATLGPIDWEAEGGAGEAFMKQFMSRCIS